MPLILIKRLNVTLIASLIAIKPAGWARNSISADDTSDHTSI